MNSQKRAVQIKVDDCWRRIGVWGSKECPELANCLHCHNCEIFSRTGRQLLDRKLPAGYTQTWTKLLAKPEENPLSGRVSILIFRIGPEWLAMPTQLFVEVMEVKDVHSLPHRNNKILRGLINVRGDLQLCFSAGTLLGVDKDFSAENTDDSKAFSRMLLVSMEGEQLAFFANEVYGLHLYHPSELKPLPATLPKETSAYSKGLLHWRDRHVAVLDEAIVIKKLMESIQ